MGVTWLKKTEFVCFQDLFKGRREKEWGYLVCVDDCV